MAERVQILVIHPTHADITDVQVQATIGTDTNASVLTEVLVMDLQMLRRRYRTLIRGNSFAVALLTGGVLRCELEADAEVFAAVNNALISNRGQIIEIPPAVARAS